MRPHLHFYPEDTGQYRREARQSDRWLHELPADLTTPMIRQKSGDYYIHEPALLDDGNLWMPIRWFERNGDLFFKSWKMTKASVDSKDGWWVEQESEYEHAASCLLKNFPSLVIDHPHYGFPSPSEIHGMYRISLSIHQIFI